MFGLSYVCLFEAFYRGRRQRRLAARRDRVAVGRGALGPVPAPHERVGPRLVAGAALVVAGGVLIGVFR